MRFPTKCCINGVNFIRLLLLSTELFKFEIQKYGQILCVHKPYFLMPGHIFVMHEIYRISICMQFQQVASYIVFLLFNMFVYKSSYRCFFIIIYTPRMIFDSFLVTPGAIRIIQSITAVTEQPDYHSLA